MEQDTLFTSVFMVTLLAGAIRLAGPVLLAALGEIFGELSGILNVGIEGTMIFGALAGYLVSFSTGSPLLGLLAGIAIGIVLHLALAWMYIEVGASQVVVGIVFNTLAFSLSNYIHRVAVGMSGVKAGQSVQAPMFEKIHIPGLSDIPFIGPILFQQNILIYVTFFLVVIGGFVLYRTRFGLNLRATGEHPRAADSAGINVFRTRYIGMMIAGATAGMAGAYLVVGELGIFKSDMVAGRGFIALAIVIFGRWNPFMALFAALIFGAADTLQLGLQLFEFGVPSQLLNSLPYLLTVIVMSGVLGKAITPTALMQPYSKE